MLFVTIQGLPIPPIKQVIETGDLTQFTSYHDALVQLVKSIQEALANTLTGVTEDSITVSSPFDLTLEGQRIFVTVTSDDCLLSVGGGQELTQTRILEQLRIFARKWLPTCEHIEVFPPVFHRSDHRIFATADSIHN